MSRKLSPSERIHLLNCARLRLERGCLPAAAIILTTTFHFLLPIAAGVS
jgi:hypothetical protein